VADSGWHVGSGPVDPSPSVISRAVPVAVVEHPVVVVEVEDRVIGFGNHPDARLNVDQRGMGHNRLSPNVASTTRARRP
jgi:hypothetical protein